jgi:hypothetical protein
VNADPVCATCGKPIGWTPTTAQLNGEWPILNRIIERFSQALATELSHTTTHVPKATPSPEADEGLRIRYGY